MKILIQSIARLRSKTAKPFEIFLNLPQNETARPSASSQLKYVHKLLNIGRHHNNHIVVSDDSVSRFHIELEIILDPQNPQNEGLLIVRNISNRPNTWLNRNRLEPLQESLIRIGDYLQLGGIIFKFEATNSAGPLKPFEVAPGLLVVAEVIREKRHFIPNGVSFPPLAEQPSVSPSTGKAALNNSSETKAGIIRPSSPIENSHPLLTDRLRKPTVATSTPVASAQFDSLLEYSQLENLNGTAQTGILYTLGHIPQVAAVWKFLRLDEDPIWLPWASLVFLTLAEILTNLVSYQFGLIVHTVLLLCLLGYGAGRYRSPGGRLSLALCTGPLIRLLSLSLPLAEFPQLLWYPLVAVPLLMAVFLVCRQLRLSRQSLGLTSGNLIVQIMLAGGGFSLGAFEYAILRPAPLISDFTWLNVIIAGVILTLFTGFNEEMIFRGLLQAVALPQLKKWAITYVSIVFAVLHIGYKSLMDVVFVFAVGFVFGYIVMWGGSLLGVTIAHGLTNLMLFGILPNLTILTGTAGGLQELINWLIGIGSVSSLSAILWLGWQAFLRSEFKVLKIHLPEAIEPGNEPGNKANPTGNRPGKAGKLNSELEEVAARR